MNNLQKFESRKGHELLVKNQNGTVMIQIDSVAKGLGFTRMKDNKEYVRWDRINAYLNEFTQSWGKESVVRKYKSGDYIEEPYFFLLAMKANNEVARIFQTWAATEVFPAIRQNGCYFSSEITVEQIKAAQRYLNSSYIKKTLLSCSDEELEKEYKLISAVNKDVDKTVIKQLQKREPSILTNKLLLKLMNKETNKIKRINKKLEKKIDKLEPRTEEYSILNVHGFSVNLQYTTDGAKIKRSDKYNEWLNKFPVHEIPSLKHIDFKKNVDVYLKFDHVPRIDVSNMHKSIIDKICWELKVNDNKVQLQKCVTNKHVKSKEEGKIYICIKQG